MNTRQKILCASILLVAVFTITNFNTFAFAELSLFTYGDIMSPDGRLLILGTIDDSQTYSSVDLIIFDPAGEILYSPELEINAEGEFQFLVTPTTSILNEGVYTVEATHQDFAEKAKLEFTVTSQASKIIFDENMETEIIPEFGAITIMILVVSILSIMIITAKSKIMFKPFTAN